MRARPRALGAIALVVLIVILHHGAVRAWWAEDDPAVLVHAATTSPLAVLTEPQAYRALSLSSFTPLVTISFDADLAIAGMTPSFFYWHQLVALSASAVLLFLLLCRLPGRRALPAAWIATAGFVASPLGTYAARTLMIRHYVEGLMFSLAALLFDGVRQESRHMRIGAQALGALCYALALTAKEVYAPLPLLLIFQQRARGDSWRSVIVRMVPYAVVAVAFVFWRSHMLGSIGGYSSDTSPLQALAASVSGVWQIIALAVMPEGLVPGAVACVVILAIAGIMARPKPAVAYLVIAAVVAFLPLAGAASDPQVRYAFIPLVLLFAGGGMAAAVAKRREVLAVLALLAMVSAAGGWFYAQRLERGRQAQYAEGRYILEQPTHSPTLLGTSSSWYLEGLERLRRLEGRGNAPRYLLSPDGVILEGVAASQLVAARAGGSSVLPLDRASRRALSMHGDRFSPREALEVEVEVEQGVMRWSLGPAEGAFAYLVLPSFYPLEIDAEGMRRVGGREPFRIRRTLPDGSWTVSPELVVPAEGEGIVWRNTE